MTPTRRRSATPASQGPTGTAPDVPLVAAPKAAPSAKTKDGTQLVGPEGEPLAQETRTPDATETGQVGSDDGAATQSRRRPRGYPLPVWPD